MKAGQSPTILAVNGALTVENSSTLKSEVLQAFEESENVVLDLSSVEELDLAGLQVLYAAKAEALAVGKELHFRGSLPQRVNARLATCGILRISQGRPEDFETALVGF